MGDSQACKEGQKAFNKQKFWVTTKHARRNGGPFRLTKHAKKEGWGDNQACKEGEMVGHFASPSMQGRRVLGDNEACKEG